MIEKMAGVKDHLFSISKLFAGRGLSRIHTPGSLKPAQNLLFS